MCWYALFSSWYNNFYFHVSLSCIGIFKKDHLFSIIISCCDEICACLVIHGLASTYTLTKNLSEFKKKPKTLCLNFTYHIFYSISKFQLQSFSCLCSRCCILYNSVFLLFFFKLKAFLFQWERRKLLRVWCRFWSFLQISFCLKSIHFECASFQSNSLL